MGKFLMKQNTMQIKSFLLRRKGLHLWLAADLILLAGFYLCRGQRAWMNTLTAHVTGPLRRSLGDLCYRTEISIMEVISVLAVLAGAAYLLWSIAAVVRAKGRRLDRIYGALLGAACAVVMVYDIFWLLWGVNFWADSFQDKSGIRAQPVAREDLTAVTAHFARQLSLAADQIPRDEYGLFDVPREEILAKSDSVYSGAEALFPFLEFADKGVKPMVFSRLMSEIDFTGFYCPYTGESNVNVDSPACLLPSTAAHELAHQRGVASEDRKSVV